MENRISTEKKMEFMSGVDDNMKQQIMQQMLQAMQTAGVDNMGELVTSLQAAGVDSLGELVTAGSGVPPRSNCPASTLNETVKQTKPSKARQKKTIRIELSGLSNSSLNGRRGNRVEYIPDKDRYKVVLDPDESSSTKLEKLLVKPRNLNLLPSSFGKAVQQDEVTSSLHGLIEPYPIIDGEEKVQHHLIRYWKLIFSHLDLIKGFHGEELRCLCKLFRDSIPKSTCTYMTVPSIRFPTLKMALDHVNVGKERFMNETMLEIRLLPGIHKYTQEMVPIIYAEDHLPGVKICRSNLRLSGYGKDKTIIECQNFFVHQLTMNVEIRDLAVVINENGPDLDFYKNPNNSNRTTGPQTFGSEKNSSGFVSVFCTNRDHLINTFSGTDLTATTSWRLPKNVNMMLNSRFIAMSVALGDMSAIMDKSQCMFTYYRNNAGESSTPRVRLINLKTKSLNGKYGRRGKYNKINCRYTVTLDNDQKKQIKPINLETVTANNYCTINRCDFFQSRQMCKLNQGSCFGSRLNLYCSTPHIKPYDIRNLLEAGADIDTCYSNHPDKYVNNNKPAFMNLVQLPDPNNQIIIEDRLSILGMFLQHDALDVDQMFEIEKLGMKFALPVLEQLFSFAMSLKNPNMIQMVKMEPWRIKHRDVIIQMILKMLAHPNICIDFVANNSCGNIVRNACCTGEPSILENVLALGGNVNNVDIDNMNPLFYSITCASSFNKADGFKECVRLLALSDQHDPKVLNMVNHVNGVAAKEAKAKGLSNQELAMQLGVGQTVLTWAALRCSDANFELICAMQGIDLNKKNQIPSIQRDNPIGFNSMSALTICSGNGNFNKLTSLIKHGADRTELGMPLLTATTTNNTTMVHKLLELGANVNSSQPENRDITPLIVASQCGENHLIKLFIDAGANIEQTNDVGTTPLMIAVQYGQIGSTKLLLERGANVNYIKRKDHTSALTIAAGFGHPTIVKMLIAAGANLDLADDEGWTSLFMAATRGYVRCTTILIDAGANINQATTGTRGGGGFSPLAAVVMQGKVNMVQLLLNKGANGNHKTTAGCTPTSLAIWGQAPDIMSIDQVTGMKGSRHNPNSFSKIQCLLRVKGFTSNGKMPASQHGMKLCSFPTTMLGCDNTYGTDNVAPRDRGSSGHIGGGSNYEGSKEKP